MNRKFFRRWARYETCLVGVRQVQVLLNASAKPDTRDAEGAARPNASIQCLLPCCLLMTSSSKINLTQA